MEGINTHETDISRMLVIGINCGSTKNDMHERSKSDGVTGSVSIYTFRHLFDRGGIHELSIIATVLILNNTNSSIRVRHSNIKDVVCTNPM